MATGLRERHLYSWGMELLHVIDELKSSISDINMAAFNTVFNTTYHYDNKAVIDTQLLFLIDHQTRLCELLNGYLLNLRAYSEYKDAISNKVATVVTSSFEPRPASPIPLLERVTDE